MAFSLANEPPRTLKNILGAPFKCKCSDTKLTTLPAAEPTVSDLAKRRRLIEKMTPDKQVCPVGNHNQDGLVSCG